MLPTLYCISLFCMNILYIAIILIIFIINVTLVTLDYLDLIMMPPASAFPFIDFIREVTFQLSTRIVDAL